MSWLRQGVSKYAAPIAFCRAKTYVIVVSAVLIGGCSGSKTPEEPVPQSKPVADALRGQYMYACTQEEAFRKDKRTQFAACECVFDAARKRLNDVQMEMLVATRSRDKQRQAEIRARPDYGDAAFKANMAGFGEETVACVVGKTAQ